ncbi:hypothetical protein PROFUN_12385 [Planoprotostelium fungivorum]|uniref:Uncharacterized protein n=1 Tax=Planoprotostelium fungivorum TaxID=1890364 RepID=A0A2P6N7G5_9EUKA|nr:hypothetical protein PROFUN_12385 [Planoprotostelium fungivorum]
MPESIQRNTSEWNRTTGRVSEKAHIDSFLAETMTLSSVLVANSNTSIRKDVRSAPANS